ncbi:MAG: RAMP superfamily CRISPR-associated protein [Thermoprotei archaeon]
MREKYTNVLVLGSFRANTESDGYAALRDDFEIDLRTMVVKVWDSNGGYSLVIPGSSIRGLIRRQAERLDSSKEVVRELFGDDITVAVSSKPRPGKLVVGFGRVEGLEDLPSYKRYGIRITRLGTVERNALYSYEFLRGSEPLRVVFDVVSLIPLSEGEKKLLANSILCLKYSNVGWGASRGLGLVVGVELDGKLKQFSDAQRGGGVG